MIDASIVIESCQNGSLKMIDCGVGTFSRSDSAINPGTIIRTNVKFNKKFNGIPIVIVSWRELNASNYLDVISITDTSTDGFASATKLTNNDTWKYTWYFNWIAIST